MSGAISNRSEDESYEILDLTEITDTTWIQRAFKDISKASAAKQITVGGVTGWCAGYLFTKVGKLAATALGGSLLILQIASYKGYIKVNWGKVERSMENARKRIERKTSRAFPRLMKEGQQFVEQNMFLAGGFAGGFLLGMAS